MRSPEDVGSGLGHLDGGQDVPALLAELVAMLERLLRGGQLR